MSCDSQNNQNATTPAETPGEETSASQLGQYMVASLEDKNHHLWFGTLSKGAAKYDGQKLQYYTMEDGLPDNAVVSIVESKQGTLWIGTHNGLSQYDGQGFTNYSEEDGLCHFRVSTLLIDSKDHLWIGTWGGVCRYDGSRFIPFPLPKPEVNVPPNPDTEDWITTIIEDAEGNIWFGRDGYGACRYDGTSFTHFTKKEGLLSNNVHAIEEDADGNFWFGTRVAEKDLPDPAKRTGPGGLNKYDGQNFTSFPEIAALSTNDVYDIYIDRSEKMWITTLKEGLYEYDGKQFINHPIRHSSNGDSKPVVGLLEDHQGNLWISCVGGLYRMSDNEIINVTTAGPWK
jgi:ligand-binding sensor domain-containing protein